MGKLNYKKVLIGIGALFIMMFPSLFVLILLSGLLILVFKNRTLDKLK